MNKEERTAIGPWLLMPLLIVAALSHGLLNLPHYAVRIMGNNAYLAFPFMLIYLTPALTAIYALAKRFPGQSLIQQGKNILGPVLGTVASFGYLAFLLLFIAMLTRDIINLAGVYFLLHTPASVLAMIYLLAAVYLASRGVETLTRTASIIVIPALLILLLLTVVGYQNVNPLNLKPVLTPNLSVYFRGALASFQVYYMFGLAAMILPFLKPLKTFPRFAGGGVLLLTLLFTSVAAGAIGLTGPVFLQRFAYPSQLLFRNIDLPQLLLGQTGMVITITWLTMILPTTGFGHYTVALGLSQLVPRYGYKTYVWLLAPIKLLLVLLPPGVLQSKMLMDFTARFGWIPFFGYPLLLWLIAVIFGRKGESKAAAV